MFIAQLSNLFSSHWGLVVGIGVLFFLLQIGLCIHFLRHIQRDERMLRALYERFLAGSGGREGTDLRGASFPWLRWVLENFPAGTTTPPGNYSREDVLQELDTRIASSSDYLLLQRLGVMAPLLGVILTVLGFFFLDVPNTELALKDILLAVAPLVSGVGAGAVLALINQAMLHVVGGKAESLRMTARTWFDAVIWSGVGLDTQAATVKSITAIEKMARTISDAADKQHANADRLIEATNAIHHAAGMLGKSVVGFGGTLRDLPETLAALQTATRDTATALQKLIPVGQRAVAGLDVSVSAFRTAVEHEFIEAAKLHRSVIGGMAQSVEQVGASTTLLQTGATDLKNTVQAHGESFRALHQSIAGDVLPAQAEFHAVVGDLSQQMVAMRGMVESFSGNVSAVAREFASVSGQLEPAVHAFRVAVDGQFTAATGQHRQNLESLTAAVERIQQAAQALAKGTTTVGGLLAEQAKLGQQLSPAQDALRATLETIAKLGDRFTAVIEHDVAPAQQKLRTSADSFGDSAQQLAQFIHAGVEPATRRLAELDQTLAGLDGTVELLRTLPTVRPELERLLTSLAETAKVAESLRDFPQQLQAALEHAATPHAEPNEPSRWNLFRRGGKAS